MKMFLAIAAAMVAATSVPATAAPAAPAAGVQQRVVVHERTTVRRSYGPRYRWRTVCRTDRRHGVRHRVCRRTRYRY